MLFLSIRGMFNPLRLGAILVGIHRECTMIMILPTLGAVPNQDAAEIGHLALLKTRSKSYKCIPDLNLARAGGWPGRLHAGSNAAIIAATTAETIRSRRLLIDYSPWAAERAVDEISTCHPQNIDVRRMQPPLSALTVIASHDC